VLLHLNTFPPKAYNLFRCWRPSSSTGNTILHTWTSNGFRMYSTEPSSKRSNPKCACCLSSQSENILQLQCGIQSGWSRISTLSGWLYVLGPRSFVHTWV